MKTIVYNNSEIRFGDLATNNFNELLASDPFKNAKKIIITDENVADIWLTHFITNFDALKDAEIIQLPAGEENKVLEICSHVWNALSEYEVGRTDLIINIGGGVITDMGGFIAATYKRGLHFINVPTTLLAQVDASVGGKTGVDLGPFKNQVGVFADADFVFIDTCFLSTLNKTELLSGFAEMLKHGLIALKAYWNDLKKLDPSKDYEKLTERIRTSVSIKREIVAVDHQEQGARKKLNFGHTLGHALEGYALTEGETIPHGYGVAWGMIGEAFISKELGLLKSIDFNEINATIRGFYPELKMDLAVIPALKKLLQNDKKNEGGELKFTLLEGIGNAVYNQNVPESTIDAAFEFILSPAE